MVVCAHVGVALSEWDIDIDARANVSDPFGQGWRDDSEVVELEHVLDPVVLVGIAKPLLVGRPGLVLEGSGATDLLVKLRTELLFGRR